MQSLSEVQKEKRKNQLTDLHSSLKEHAKAFKETRLSLKSL